MALPRDEYATYRDVSETLLTRFIAWKDLSTNSSSEEWVLKYLPHYCRNRPSTMHRWIYNVVDTEFDKRGQRVALVGPRGGAKSTSGTLVTALRRAVERREKYILITSDTQTQAVEHLSAIKEELTTNEQLADDYPASFGEGPVWKTNKIVLRNGVTIRAAGTLSRIRGLRRKQDRPSLIILDDPENDEHISSEIMRGRTWSWFTRTLMNMGSPETNYLVMGTAMHINGLAMRVLRSAGYHVFRDYDTGKPGPFRSIMRWPVRMDLWDLWESKYLNVDNPDADKDSDRFYRKNEADMLKGCELLWPDREPLLPLMKLRAQIGHQAFESEKQGNAIDPSTCEWPEEYFNYDDLYFDAWPKASDLTYRVVSLDPSKGKNSKKGDYSAIVSIALGSNGIYYVDADMERRNTSVIVDDSVKAVKKFKPNKFVGEKNQFQELLIEDIVETFDENGIDIPVDGIENRVNKMVRIRRLGSLLHKKRMKFKRGSKGALLLLQQLKDFPNADHDDGPDALEQGMRAIADDLGFGTEIDDGLPDHLEVE